MKIFLPQAETITQLMVNTVGSESVMKERQEKRNGIKNMRKWQINHSKYLANKFSTICHTATAPRKSPYI